MSENAGFDAFEPGAACSKNAMRKALVRLGRLLPMSEALSENMVHLVTHRLFKGRISVQY